MTTTADPTIRNPASGAALWLRRTSDALFRGLKSHAAIYAIALTIYATGLLQSAVLGKPVELGLAGIFSSSTLLAIAGLVCFQMALKLVGLWRTGHAGSPTLALLRSLFEDILTPGRVANTFHAFVALGLFTIGFVTIKTNIPAVHPFSWDETFMELDRLIHFGVLPNRLLAPLLQHPVVTFVLNVFYNLWFFLMIGFFLWQGIREKDTPLRQRFIIAYLASWALGTCLMGTIFSSAGPCYYGLVVPGPDPYAGLMAYLNQVNETYPIWALTAQQLLWESYTTSNGAISGISAMPSMHVGTAVLFFLCARAAGIRWLAWGAALFAAAIFLGSVMLAWHYAVDGYAGALIALACWKLAGWWVARDPFSATRLSSRPS